MAINFNEIFDMNIPFVYAELKKAISTTGTIKQEYTALIFGQKTADGTAVANEIVDIFSKEEAQAKFGKTSMLSASIGRYYDINKSVKLKVIPLDDNSTGTQASGSITITGTATSNGTVAFYVNGRAYKVAVSVGNTGAEIATLLAAKIAEYTDNQFTAVVDGTVAEQVNITAVHKGTYGNTLKAMINYNTDDVTPIGLTPTIVGFSGGAGDPDLTTTGVQSILENNQFNLIAQPYTDNANLSIIDVALTDNFKATELLDGFCLVGLDDTVTNLTTKTDTLNSSFITVLDNNSIFATGFEQAAGMIALIGDIAQSNPGAGYLNKELAGFLPLDERIRTERNVLAGGGVATYKKQGSKVIIDRTVTTLQRDAQGISIAVDETDLRVFLTISYVRYTFIVRMSQYQNFKVGNDNDLFGPGVQVMTPNLYKQYLVLNYEQLVNDAVCENLKEFEDSVVVEKVGNRMNSTMKINVINVLLQQAMQIRYEV